MYTETIIPFVMKNFVFENEESYDDYPYFLAEFYFPNSISMEDAIENDYMYLTALELAEQGEYTMLNFPIDENLDLLKLSKDISLNSYGITTNEMEISEYFMLCAQIALEEEYWKDRDICPLSGKEADFFVRWTVHRKEIPYNELWWKTNEVYFLQADVEELKLFQLAVYYQTEENPDESYLNKNVNFIDKGTRGLGFVLEDKPFQDTINPNYYTWHPVAECKDISQEFDGNLAQAIQYIWRSGCPGNTKSEDVTEDLKKAIRFLEFEIERVQESTD